MRARSVGRLASVRRSSGVDYWDGETGAG